MKFGPLLLRIFYPRQPKACWKCASLDHIGRECPSNFCFSRHHLGHQAHQCEERIRCSLCKSYHHLANDCLGNWAIVPWHREPLEWRNRSSKKPLFGPKTSRIWITLMNPWKNTLDQEKAFDCVDRSFLLNLLKLLGFSPWFCRCISALYKGAYMQVLVNDFLSDPISLQRGAQQGDALSPLFYIVCVEVLACKIRATCDI